MVEPTASETTESALRIERVSFLADRILTMHKSASSPAPCVGAHDIRYFSSGQHAKDSLELAKLISVIIDTNLEEIRNKKRKMEVLPVDYSNFDDFESFKTDDIVIDRHGTPWVRGDFRWVSSWSVIAAHRIANDLNENSNVIQTDGLTDVQLFVNKAEYGPFTLIYRRKS